MWEAAQNLGYTPITTFWEDFTIADHFGEEAIRDTAKRAFTEWQYDYKYLTELVMVINHKSWEHVNDSKLCKLYSELYYMYDGLVYELIKDNKEAVNYYFQTLD